MIAAGETVSHLKTQPTDVRSKSTRFGQRVRTPPFAGGETEIALVFKSDIAGIEPGIQRGQPHRYGLAI